MNVRRFFMRYARIDPDQVPFLFLTIITMTVIAAIVQIDRMQNRSKDLRAKAYLQTPSGVRVEAEDMVLTGVTKDQTGTFIEFSSQIISPTPYPPWITYTCPPSGYAPAGMAMIDVDLNISANYHIWVQMRGTGNANTLWLQLDDRFCVKVGDLASMPANTWEWVDYQDGNTANKIPSPIIGTGHRIIKLFGNASEPGVAVDRILLVRDPACVPTGLGDTCIGVVSTPTPTPAPTLTPTPTQTPPTPTKKGSPNAPIITTTTLPKAKKNVSYSASVVATDSTISDTLSLTATNLPAGLALTTCSQTDGLGGSRLDCPLVGTPITKGMYSPAFTVTDASGSKTSKTIKILVQ